MMKISVIIPNYNNENTIKKCVKSIYSQKRDIEIMVIDDFSKDKSIHAIKKNFPAVKLVYNKKNKG